MLSLKNTRENISLIFAKDHLFKFFMRIKEQEIKTTTRIFRLARTQSLIIHGLHREIRIAGIINEFEAEHPKRKLRMVRKLRDMQKHKQQSALYDEMAIRSFYCKFPTFSGEQL